MIPISSSNVAFPATCSLKDGVAGYALGAFGADVISVAFCYIQPMIDLIIGGWRYCCIVQAGNV